MQIPDYYVAFLLTGTSVFVLIYILTAIRLKRAVHPVPSPTAVFPEIAVLIAMRDEEARIEHCLAALERQSYPKEHFQVLIIDDQSSDRSPEIVADYVNRNAHFKMMRIENQKPGLKGKMNALACALEQTECEIVLITDADCIVPPDWVQRYTAYFGPESGLVGGLTLLYPMPGQKVPDLRYTFFHKLQAVDWLFLQIVSAKTSHAGRPVTVLGNNFGFRKEAYDDVGGFENIGFSVTEDYALMNAIKRTGRWQIHHTLDPLNTIFSFPLDTVRAFFHQRKRWVIGGKRADFHTYFLMMLTTITHFILMVSLFTPGNFLWKGGLWAVVLISDYRILVPELKRLKLNFLKRYFPAFEVFYFIYTVFFALLALLPSRVAWKGRTY